jgi:predicted transcriptional regulator
MSVVLVYRGDEESNNKTIIIPNAEYAIIKLLGEDEMIAPEISRKSNKKYSSPTVASLLKRLQKRGLVSRTEKLIELNGSTFKRVVFKKIYVTVSVTEV